MIKPTLLLLKAWGLPVTTEKFPARPIFASLLSTPFVSGSLLTIAGLYLTFEFALTSLLRCTVLWCRFLESCSLVPDLKSSSSLLEEEEEDDDDEDSAKISDRAWGAKMFTVVLLVFFFWAFPFKSLLRPYWSFVSSGFSILTKVASASAISFFNWASIS